MRIAGGVILLIIGLWSMVGGGCSLFAGKVTSEVAKGSKALHKFNKDMAKLAKKHGGKYKYKGNVGKASAKVKSTGQGLFISGIVILAGGVLCLIAGIMFLVNKGKMFGFLAPGVGIIGEVLFFAMVTFNVIGLVKAILLGFAAFCATKIGEQA